MSDADAQQAAVDQKKVIGDGAALAPTEEEKKRSQAMRDFSHGAGTGGGNPTMRVKVYSPFRSYYDDQAFSISAENATGPFDVLPRHHSFISLLSACELVIRSVSYGDRRIRISGGIMHVKADHVIVFLDV